MVAHPRRNSLLTGVRVCRTREHTKLRSYNVCSPRFPARQSVGNADGDFGYGRNSIGVCRSDDYAAAAADLSFDFAQFQHHLCRYRIWIRRYRLE